MSVDCAIGQRVDASSTVVVFGPRASYPRMKGFMTELAAMEQPPTFLDTGQHWDPALIGDGFGPLVAQQTHRLDLRTSSLEVITEACSRFLGGRDISQLVVYGDTNTALGAALAAFRRRVPVTHLEAGCRAYDRDGVRIAAPDSPEEQNRLQIDSIASYLVPLTATAAQQLVAEGVTGTIAEPTGHPLADRLMSMLPALRSVPIQEGSGLLTLHRTENTQGPDSGVRRILQQLAKTGIRWTFPIMPGVKNHLEQYNIALPPNVIASPPLSHQALMLALQQAGVVVTDAAGLGLEATLLGQAEGDEPMPIVVPRDLTEFPEQLPRVMLVDPDQVVDAIPLARAKAAATRPSLDRFREHFATGSANQQIMDAILRQCG